LPTLPAVHRALVAKGNCDRSRYYSWVVIATIPTVLIFTPGDFNPSGAIQKHLVCNQLATDSDTKQAVICWLQSIDSDIFYITVQASSPQCDKCSNVNGDSVESGVYHLLHMYHRSQNNVLASECLLPYFLKLPCTLKTNPVPSDFASHCIRSCVCTALHVTVYGAIQVPKSSLV
jgi:hypothetical protein